MYRFTTHLSNSHLVLVRKKLSDGSCAALIVMRSPSRQYAKNYYAEKCPDTKPIVKSRKLLFSVIGATLMTGAAIVYAKNSKDTRNWLSVNAPWADRVIQVAYQETETYGQFIGSKGSAIKQAVTDFLFGKEGITPLDFKQQSEQDLEEDAKKGFAPKTYPLPPIILENLYVEEHVPGQAEVELEATLVQTDKCEIAPKPEIHITKEALELEQDMHKYTRIAIDDYKKATKLTTEFNKVLFKIIESPPGNESLYAALKGTRTERDRVMKEANDASARAHCAFDNMERMISKNVLKAPMEELTQTKRFIKSFRADLSEAEQQLSNELKKSEYVDKYWDKVEAARAKLKNELETLLPGIDLCARKLDAAGDLDIFIMYTLNQIEFLQNAIAELQTVQEHKINKAIECNDQQQIIELKAQDLYKKEKFEKELEYQKKVLAAQAEAKKKLKAELQKQFEMQEKVTAKQIAKKEAEINAKANRQASEEIAKERAKFKKELAAMSGKLKAIEQTLKKRAAAEAEARKSQTIWAAAEALLAATRKPTTTATVNNELDALNKAGKQDKVVQTVLKGIPKEAREKGIATEKALKDRFDVLEQTASKVALIGRTGGTLPMYFLSWLQSKLLFQTLASIPQHELDNIPVDFNKLDTFDIIHRARYHMDHGELGAAVRYVNLLQGAPRAAAACWLDAARRHLEVRQAAETVMAHASLAAMVHK